jgi:hypothetical protein
MLYQRATARYTFGAMNAQIERCSGPRPRHRWQWLVLTRLHLLMFEQVAGRDVEPARTCLHQMITDDREAIHVAAAGYRIPGMRQRRMAATSAATISNAANGHAAIAASRVAHVHFAPVVARGGQPIATSYAMTVGLAGALALIANHN